MPSATADPPIEPIILREAADWMLVLRSGATTPEELAQLHQWRERSKAHERVWQRMQAVSTTLAQVPPALGRETLSRLERKGSRRRLLSWGAAALVVAPGVWLIQRETTERVEVSHLSTRIGERSNTQLADNTQLALNSGTVLDIAFSNAERRLTLERGEVLVTTGKDISPVSRPLIVHSPEGKIQALGTRFSVRRLDGITRVAVFEGRVAVQSAGGASRRVLSAGDQLDFSATSLGPVARADASATLWERGMLLAKHMRLDALLKEFARHTPERLQCDPAVAALPVSGAFALNDIPASLALLERSLPLRVVRLPDDTLRVQPRSQSQSPRT